jgi:hypothetical protein
MDSNDRQHPRAQLHVHSQVQRVLGAAAQGQQGGSGSSSSGSSSLKTADAASAPSAVASRLAAVRLVGGRQSAVCAPWEHAERCAELDVDAVVVCNMSIMMSYQE